MAATQVAAIYYMEYLIYQDKPNTDIWMKMVLGIPLIALAAGGVIAMREDAILGFMLVGEAVFLLIVYICIIPTAYGIYSDKIQIGFRMPWSFNIPFNNIKTLKPPRWFSGGINLPTCFSTSRALEIIRLKGMPVNISPTDRQVFIDQFQKAYNDWQRANG
jgi:hypothetical protein